MKYIGDREILLTPQDILDAFEDMLDRHFGDFDSEDLEVDPVSTTFGVDPEEEGFVVKIRLFEWEDNKS
jgi:hypothetical protein